MQPLQAYLLARNLDETVAYYRDILGFAAENLMNGPDGKLGHAEMVSGAVRIMFGTSDDVPEEQRAHFGAGVTFYIGMGEGDVDGYFQAVTARGARIADPLSDKPWGDRSFIALDPSGYQLMFARPGQMPQ